MALIFFVGVRCRRRPLQNCVGSTVRASVTQIRHVKNAGIMHYFVALVSTLCSPIISIASQSLARLSPPLGTVGPGQDSQDKCQSSERVQRSVKPIQPEIRAIGVWPGFGNPRAGPRVQSRILSSMEGTYFALDRIGSNPNARNRLSAR